MLAARDIVIRKLHTYANEQGGSNDQHEGFFDQNNQ
jgi:hypothetical protein